MKKTKMLKKNYEFKRVLSKGKYYTGKNIEVFIQKNNKKINYIGLAISAKVSKAVMRNKIKRLIRENYKEFEDHLNCGYNIVFLWKKQVSTDNAKYNEIKSDFIEIFDKANMIKNNKEIV